MELNVGKCSAITFTRENNLIVILFDYSIDGQSLKSCCVVILCLKSVNEVKDLDIIIVSKLTFD